MPDEMNFTCLLTLTVVLLIAIWTSLGAAVDAPIVLSLLRVASSLTSSWACSLLSVSCSA